MNNIDLSRNTEDITNDKIERIDNTPYDDVFKTLRTDCPSLLIPVINELFDEHFTGDEKVVFFPNDHMIHMQDNTTKEKRTDSCFEIQGDTPKKYHLECQSTEDKTMLIRMVEYDLHIALDEGVINENVLVLNIPHSAVLYLRHTKNTPDVLRIQVNTSNGSIAYDIPVMKTKNYTIEQIFEKNLLFLIPFHIFCFENSFKEYEDNPEKLNKLIQEYEWIRQRLENLCIEGKITELYLHALKDMTKRVVENLAQKYRQVQKGMSDVMSGKVLDYEAKTIFRQGVAQGREDGIREGLSEGLRINLRKGIISLINFSQSVNASAEQTLQALMKEYQLSQEDANKYIQEYWKEK